ncbi:hypothetical protein SteCoe_25860 [Stentor coeruleus]|uniref:Casein kinase I n=1 Tax=Stentor coeruleus TaxID=5963 RepID=A0A1R2BEA1_9CILI|nr:hypothetical protein SteCoe_25860 [Stentor coeruleus]
MLEIRVGNKFRLGKKIGSGSFGEIFLGINIQSNEEVAVKLENISCRHPQLNYESKILKLLQEGEGVPSMIWFGNEGIYNVLIMELLGPSLEDLFLYCNRKFSLKTVLMIADQILSRIEFMHSKNFIHRDIKPDNFLIGLGNKSNTIFMIDFGLAKKFRDSKNFAHIPFKEGKSLTGTARYASISTHMGYEQSRRDDIESLFYVVAYLLLGGLPWQGITAQTKQEKYSKILDKKKNSIIDHTYQDLPQELLMYFSYCRSLKFEEKPDYVYLKSLFRDAMNKENFNHDFIYDWTIQNYSTHKQLRSKIIDDLRKNNTLEESRQALNESHIVSIQPTTVQVQIPLTDEKSKNKCLVF